MVGAFDGRCDHADQSPEHLANCFQNALLQRQQILQQTIHFDVVDFGVARDTKILAHFDHRFHILLEMLEFAATTTDRTVRLEYDFRIQFAHKLAHVRRQLFHLLRDDLFETIAGDFDVILARLLVSLQSFRVRFENTFDFLETGLDFDGFDLNLMYQFRCDCRIHAECSGRLEQNGFCLQRREDLVGVSGAYFVQPELHGRRVPVELWICVFDVGACFPIHCGRQR